MSYEYEQFFLFSLLLTLAVEIPVAVLLIKSVFKDKETKILKIVFTGFIASALTLPYFWLILPIYISNRDLYIFIGEASIIFLEAIIYNQFLRLSLPKAFIVSLVANIASIFLGLIIQ
jgi:hypothetical protein